MAGDAGAAAIGILIQNLVNISKEEISLMKGLRRNADKLSSTFSIIQGLLNDAQRKNITEEGVRAWLKQLEDMAFDADNVLDELNYQLISERMKKSSASCFPSLNHYRRRRQMALRIKEIDSSFQSLGNTAEKLGLHSIFAEAPAADAAAASETDSVAFDPIFIGRDKDMSEIVKMLTAPTEQQQLSVLPIVGMGGLGKTTLARKIFNHQTSKAHFGHHIWVHVSQHFDAVVLLRKILKNLRGGNVEHESRDDLLKEIKDALGAKAYLLVLDDVWNEERHKWDDFINSWRGITCTNGNAILITTRKTEVGEIVKTQAIPDLSGLSEDECWSIIKGRAFMGGDIPPGLEDIGKSIAERCGGLPLAANVVGGVLRGKSRDEWLSIKHNWLSNVSPDDNNITKILKLSFDHLSSPSLKKCFAYCTVFPKGTRIKREVLIQLWMSEGFLQSSQTSDMESVGNKNFNLLLHNSLLQVLEKDDYDNVEYCGMHDLVHDLATSVVGLNDTCSDGAQYVYWEGESSHPLKEQVRTLFYRARRRGDISDINLSDFKSLHALTLVGYYIRELPDSIKELIHLRYLNIEETSIEYLPDSISELYHLQTLTSNHLKKLPSTIKYLFNFRHLYLDRDTELPPQLGMLTSLRTLRYFKVGDEEGHRIVELGGLKNLQGKLEIWNLGKVQGEEESKKACLFEKAGIVKLVLEWSESREDCDINDENVFKGLKPHANLKVLEIKGYGGACLPAWGLKMEGYDNLKEIILEGCKECKEIPRLGHLPCLKSVFLIGLKKVKSIGYSFYGIDEGGCTDVFPSLEKLELEGLGELREWAGVKNPKVKFFPCLKEFIISYCGQLRELPDGLMRLSSLKELIIMGCNSVKSINGVLSLPSLGELSLSGCQAVISLSGGIVESSAPLLERLDIDIGDWESGGFEKAWVEKAVDGILMRLPTPSLLTLNMGGIEWLPPQLQHLTSLSKLYLTDLGVEELPHWLGDLSSLRELRISSAKNLRRLPSLERLTNLTRLEILYSPLLQVRSCTKEDVSEWPKISHIPNIRINACEFQRDGVLQ